MSDEPNIFEYAQQVEALRQALARLSADHIKLKDRGTEIVNAVYRAAFDAAVLSRTAPPSRPEPDKRKKDAEVCLWHLTDWQGAKVTTSYNSDVMRHRGMLFVKKALKITEIQRADHPVRKLVIMLGGDMAEGLFNFPTQPFEIDATLFAQFVGVAKLIEDVLWVALGAYDEVEVVSEWGNHGRLGSKRDAIPKADNLDRMIYELARQRFIDEPRLAWHDSPEDIQRVEIGNYRALLMHGDEVGRAGFASPSAWQAAGNRWRSGAYPWDFQDIYLGHYHRNAEENLADGRGAIYWTGSMESDNRYARESMAAGGVPSQRLHFIDPEKGRVTAKYTVWLDD